jgi:DNA ligase D-like protein (predicted 3'-phosphoesterase)
MAVPGRLSPVLRFVVNLHQARTLHHDLRLEVPTADGSTLASWAVPKGPTMDPTVRRLAVKVDDHDVEHLTYTDESKSIWDEGTYEPAEEPGPALERGHLRFTLDGHELHGDFALTRTRMDGNDRNWILIKTAGTR